VRLVRTLMVVTAAPLVLAVVGVFHPGGLNPATARMWADMHILLLPIFPLFTLGLIVPLRWRPHRDLAGAATVIAWVAAFTFAAFYTGLDAVAGIAAGVVAQQAANGHDVGPAITDLFRTGDSLGHTGVYALAISVLATAGALTLRHGPRALAGTAVLLPATWSFYDSHIFYPRGVLTMLAFAIGFSLLAWAAGSGPAGRQPPPSNTTSTDHTSLPPPR
jgi:hypothetical protein